MSKTLDKAEILGPITIPASKSQTIRALLVALFAKSKSILHNPLISSDTESCIKLCKQMGAKIEVKDNVLKIDSSGFDFEETSPLEIDCNNSGTTLFFATALAAVLKRKITFTGDKSLQSRSALPLLNSLEDLGAKTEHDENGNAPYSVLGPMKGGKTTIECKTSQYLSALLLACPLLPNDTEISVPLLFEEPYVKITLSWLDSQKIKYRTNENFSSFTIYGNQNYHGFESEIFGDFSSAGYFFCSAAITGGSVTVNGLDPFDPQGDKGILSVLRKMGCRIQWSGNSVKVSGPKKYLEGGTFDINAMPDALPALAVCCCFAKGGASLVNVPQARLKETDRISVMARNLTKLGAKVSELPDGLVFEPITEFKGAQVDSCHDHRIAMAMAVASLASSDGVTIRNSAAVKMTFPSFFELFDSVRKPMNTTKIICTSTTENLARQLADKEAEIFFAKDVLENPQIIGEFTNLGLVFERTKQEVPKDIVACIGLLGNYEISCLEYLFTVVRADKPGKSLRIVELLAAREKCAVSYSAFTPSDDCEKTREIRRELDDREIKLPKFIPFMGTYMRLKFKKKRESV